MYDGPRPKSRVFFCAATRGRIIIAILNAGVDVRSAIVLCLESVRDGINNTDNDEEEVHYEYTPALDKFLANLRHACDLARRAFPETLVRNGHHACCGGGGVAAKVKLPTRPVCMLPTKSPLQSHLRGLFTDTTLALVEKRHGKARKDYLCIQ